MVHVPSTDKKVIYNCFLINWLTMDLSLQHGTTIKQVMAKAHQMEWVLPLNDQRTLSFFTVVTFGVDLILFVKLETRRQV